MVMVWIQYLWTKMEWVNNEKEGPKDRTLGYTRRVGGLRMK